MIKYLIMKYKQSMFQLGLQARNVNKSRKNHNNGQNRLNVINKEKTKRRRRENRRVEKRRKDKKKEKKK